MTIAHQKLPTVWAEREALRGKGQFWTPDWVASAMVAYVTIGNTDHIFDPAVGAGAFFRAAKLHGSITGKCLRLLGCEIDKSALEEALSTGLSQDDLEHVEVTDFVLYPPDAVFRAIVANPPYIRHHRLSPAVKNELKALTLRLIGRSLDGRSGLHIYFLIRALERLDVGGRLAFIMPADTCEGISARPLWNWIAKNYRIDGVVTFAPEASPFPGVDTNPMIFMIQNSHPQDQFVWARCIRSQTDDLARWAMSEFTDVPPDSLSVYERSISEGIATGLSRPPRDIGVHVGPVLGDYASVMRGIATGDNEFFFLTNNRAEELGIPHSFLKPAIGRTRDVQGEYITHDLLAELDSQGRPTLLLSINGIPFDDLPSSVRRYVEYGEKLGLPNRALIATRRPWYKMESRSVPPILFAYLGRRNTRFVRNLAGVLPLTGFLCVYPHSDDPQFIEKLWRILQNQETLENLALVGKSYGSGAVKVEPRALERLPLPSSMVAEMGLDNFVLHDQPAFVMEKRASYKTKPRS